MTMGASSAAGANAPVSPHDDSDGTRSDLVLHPRTRLGTVAFSICVTAWFFAVCAGSGVDATEPLFNVTKRGKVTYYMEGEGVISSLVTKEEADGDLLIHFAGLTGGTSKSAALCTSCSAP
eukprot:COSAG02_NODE_5809_length_4022_cov_4.543462_1_plen_121_part_00